MIIVKVLDKFDFGFFFFRYFTMGIILLFENQKSICVYGIAYTE